MTAFDESVVEDAALAWLEALGYQMLHGPDIAVGESTAERSDPNYRDVVLERRMHQALVRLNPELPPGRSKTLGASSLVWMRHHSWSAIAWCTGCWSTASPSSIGARTARSRGAQTRVIDFDLQENNDRLAVNQFTVSEGHHTRRPDVVIFLNGLPLAVIELKNAADEDANIWTAFLLLGLSRRVHERPVAPWSCGDFDGPQFLQPVEILDAFEICPNGVFDVLQGYFLGLIGVRMCAARPFFFCR